MQRTSYHIKVEDISAFKLKLLQWAQQFKVVTWLDSNNYSQKYSSYDAILAIESESNIACNYTNAFEKLKTFQLNTPDYLFGYLGFDLKNDVEKLTSNNPDFLGFQDLFFFQPKKLFFIKNNSVEVKYLIEYQEEILDDLKNIQQFSTVFDGSSTDSNIKIKLRFHKDEYYHTIEQLLKHIHRGDIYEATFCQEFYSENSVINPLGCYLHLNEISTPPFATFLKLDDTFLLSASPERYLKKTGNTVLSQPIKGTQKRAELLEDDLKLQQELENSPKERAENIMIVDLVRNDLSHSAVKGSVKVAELCKVYTFKQVHQLISTISCEIKKGVHPVDIIKDTFPMGSMTGAPKISALQIIDQLEKTKRGLYSGSVGYFTPKGDFDFNVIIRSILYNAIKKYVSFSVGGAITALSSPENEYEECLLKAKAMKQVLLNTK